MKKLWIVVASLVVLGAAGGGLLVIKAKHRVHPQATEDESLAPVRANRSKEVALTIYDGKLGAGWADWGWGPHDLSSAGPAKIQFRGYGGIIFRHELLSNRYGTLSFRFKAPAAWPDFLQVSLKSSVVEDKTMPTVQISPEQIEAGEDGWSKVSIDFEQLNPQGVAFDRVSISARAAVPSDWVLLDGIVLTQADASVAASPARARNVELAVQCGGASHPISPMIYGSALGAWDSGQTAQRIGGNPTSRSNWDLDAWNTANDWFFENVKGTNVATLVAEAASHGAPTAVTVPILGWVAKDTSSVGFPAAKFPRQRKFDPHRAEAGDGFAPDGQPIEPGPPTQTSIPAPPELIGRWIRRLRDTDRARDKRAVNMYFLDNEPSLWSDTHRDVHPELLSYDELLDRTVRYATEIRAADPDPLIAGPSEWGWLGYLYSPRDLKAGKTLRPDRRAHDDLPLIPWYLREIAKREKATGTRLLDVLDVHFYPAADKIFGGDARTDAAGAALRLRSTLSLWDPDYKDESWIDEKIRLIPRLKEWVAMYHPGLRISIGEWNFGAEEHISGGLATAEALGRFGQQGLDFAYFWGGPKANTPTFWAFRAFRNFDGQGAHFLEESLPTKESKQLSLFASRDVGQNHVVAIAINRDPHLAVDASIRLDSCAAPKSARAFLYAGGSAGLIETASDASQRGSVRVTIPPYALVVLDVLLADKP
ncbi:MAG TPA: glycoside hydrolase family 44 protein [Polyangiaceae bacterium]|nr:glycoside hydrolase family 44 protein [Polyangiaceae bacterium]